MKATLSCMQKRGRMQKPLTVLTPNKLEKEGLTKR